MSWVTSIAIQRGDPVATAREIFGARLLQLLAARPDLNQSRVAEILGIDRSAVTAWIKGRSWPSDKNLDQLREIFEVELHELFHDAQQPLPTKKHREVTPTEGLRALARGMGYVLKRQPPKG